jgi:hypothetical protein
MRSVSHFFLDGGKSGVYGGRPSSTGLGEAPVKKALGVGGVIAAAMIAGGSSASAYPSPGFGGCQLAGNADFATPLTVNQPTPSVSPPTGIPPSNNMLDVQWGAPFDYTFTGDLTGCQAGSSAGPDSTAPASGKIDAGKPITIGATTYDWPFAKPHGSGGCTGSNTSGTAVVVWADDSVSIIDYSTSGALAAIGLTGNFRTGSFTFQSSAGNVSKTVALRYGHDYAGGPLAFEPPDPTACNGAGVSAAAIQGGIGEAYAQTD